MITNLRTIKRYRRWLVGGVVLRVTLRFASSVCTKSPRYASTISRGSGRQARQAVGNGREGPWLESKTWRLGSDTAAQLPLSASGSVPSPISWGAQSSRVEEPKAATMSQNFDPGRGAPEGPRPRIDVGSSVRGAHEDRVPVARKGSEGSYLPPSTEPTRNMETFQTVMHRHALELGERVRDLSRATRLVVGQDVNPHLAQNDLLAGVRPRTRQSPVCPPGCRRGSRWHLLQSGIIARCPTV